MLLSGPDEYRARFRAFVEAANAGQRFEAAWRRHVETATLDDDFAEYARGEQGSLMAAPTSVRGSGTVARAERVMRDEGVHLLWARLVPWRGETLARAEADLVEAETRAPGAAAVVHLRALFELERGRRGEAVRSLRAALERAPDDARLLHALVFALERPAEGEGARVERAEVAPLVERLARVATSADQRTTVVDSLVGAGRLEGALVAARGASQADPAS